MKRKSVLVVGLVLTMMLVFSSHIFALTAGEKTSSINVTLNVAFPGDAPAGQDEVNAAISAKMKADGFGSIKFNYTFIPWDTYWSKLDLIAASGEDYDITWEHQTTIARAVSKSMLAPLNDALKAFGPDILANTPSFVFKESTFKGKIYSIPRVSPSSQYDWIVSIRGDLREKYNIPPITDLAGYEKYLAALKANEKDMVPGDAANLRGEMFREYCPSFYFPIEDQNNTLAYIDLTDKSLTVKSFFETAMYKSMVDKEYSWNKKGYLPQINQFTDTQAAFIAGKMGATIGNVMWPTENVDAVHSALPGAKIEEVFMNPSKPKYTNVASDNLLSVFAQSKKVNESIVFLNWYRKSQENYDLWTYGIKGVNYKLNGNSVSVDGISPNHLYQPISWSWTDLRFHRFSANLDPNYITVIKNWDKDSVQSPLLGFALDREPIKKELTDLATACAQYTAPQQSGTLSYDASKADMVKAFKAAGLDRVLKEIQKQVDAFKAQK
jgi:putative aldouronate transport system substrate-binding protein